MFEHVVAPTAAVRPAPHAMQLDAPAGEYWPAGHDVHAFEFMPVVTENLPATQFVHDTCPVEFWYVPAPQFVHAIAPAAGCADPGKRLEQLS